MVQRVREVQMGKGKPRQPNVKRWILLLYTTETALAVANFGPDD